MSGDDARRLRRKKLARLKSADPPVLLSEEFFSFDELPTGPGDDFPTLMAELLDSRISFLKPEEIENENAQLTAGLTNFFARIFKDYETSDKTRDSFARVHSEYAKQHLNLLIRTISREVSDTAVRYKLVMILKSFCEHLHFAAPILLASLVYRERYHKDRRSEKARASGRKSAARRRASANVWQAAALEIAKRARTRNPRLTQSDVAEKIEAQWDKLPEGRPVGRERLMKVISDWEKSGQLPKRSTA
jgi:hypothetical protein